MSPSSSSLIFWSILIFILYWSLSMKMDLLTSSISFSISIFFLKRRSYCQCECSSLERSVEHLQCYRRLQEEAFFILFFYYSRRLLDSFFRDSFQTDSMSFLRIRVSYLSLHSRKQKRSQVLSPIIILQGSEQIKWGMERRGGGWSGKREGKKEGVVLFTIINWMINSLIDFTSGIVSGVVNTLSGFFLDTVKVRMQVDPKLTGTLQALRYIVKHEGYLQLFSGVYYPLLTLPIINSVVFSSYEGYKTARGKEMLTFWDGAESGAVAGFVVAFVTTPAELVKVIMQVSGEQRFKHSRDCLRYILRTQGWSGLMRGNVSLIIRQVPGYAAQFAIYEYFKGLFVSKQHLHLNFAESAVVCIPSAVIGWIFSYPQDVIKTRLQTEAKGKYKPLKWLPDGGFFTCGKEIYRQSGPRGFFVGLRPCLIRAAYSDSIGIMTYQKSRQLLWGFRTPH